MSDHPAFSDIATYLHLPWVHEPDEIRRLQPDIAIMGAPVDITTVHRPGARFGPRAIRNAGYIGTWAHHLKWRIEPFEHLTAIDTGDALCPPGDTPRSHEAIRQKLRSILDAAPGCIPIVLGGDHSITYPSCATVADHHDRRVGVVHFDAHADCATDSMGVVPSHATPMRDLIEHGHVAGRNFVQVGLRGYWPGPDVVEWMAEQGMRSHFIYEIEERGFDAVLDDAINEALEGTDYIYLSVDVDVMDPAFTPGTGTPEPGGITAQECLRAVRRIAREVPLVGMDVVEVSPPYDHAEITADVANRLILEAISSLAVRRQAGEPVGANGRVKGEE